MRYLLHFSYDGSCFYGFNKQSDRKTIQGEIEKVLSRRFNSEVRIVGCGRTDRGVHSLDHYAHFDVEREFDVGKLVRYLNRSLAGEIYIKDIIKVDSSFHARYCVKKKTYLYIINMGEFNPTEVSTVLQYNKCINVKLLKKASKVLIGRHSFKAFTPSSNRRDNYVREIYSFRFIVKHNYLCIYVTGDGFLRYMVRNIVGLLLDVNEGKKSLEDVRNILISEDRSINSKISLPNGLYLYEVFY